MNALSSTEILSVWQNKVIPNASSHPLYNCKLVRSPEPIKITKLKQPSRLCRSDLEAQETVSKCFLMPA